MFQEEVCAVSPMIAISTMAAANVILFRCLECYTIHHHSAHRRHCIKYLYGPRCPYITSHVKTIATTVATAVAKSLSKFKPISFDHLAALMDVKAGMVGTALQATTIKTVPVVGRTVVCGDGADAGGIEQCIDCQRLTRRHREDVLCPIYFGG